MSNKPLRERYLAGNWNRAELSLRCGWTKTNKRGYSQPDTTTLDRYLGLRPWRDAKGRCVDLIAEDKALLLAEALLMDPHEIGL